MDNIQYILAKDSDVDKLMSHLVQTKTIWDKWWWVGRYERIINHINQESLRLVGGRKRCTIDEVEHMTTKITRILKQLMSASLSLDNDKHMAKMMMLTICNIDELYYWMEIMSMVNWRWRWDWLYWWWWWLDVDIKLIDRHWRLNDATQMPSPP